MEYIPSLHHLFSVTDGLRIYGVYTDHAVASRVKEMLEKTQGEHLPENHISYVWGIRIPADGRSFWVNTWKVRQQQKESYDLSLELQH